MTLGSNERPVEILLVVDNSGDGDEIRRILQDSGFFVNIAFAQAGVTAMAYLRRDGEFAEVPLPDLILLDLAIPTLDWQQVLSEINQDTDLKSINLMVLTSTQAHYDLAYAQGIPPRNYSSKTIDPDVFARIFGLVANPKVQPAFPPVRGPKRSIRIAHVSSSGQRFCTNCGASLSPEAGFCPQCGTAVPDAQAPGGRLPEPTPQPTMPLTADTDVPNYLVQAILVTIFCCLPFGIVAIVFAAQVNGKRKSGDYAGAIRVSENAKTWCWVSFGVGGGLILLYIFAAGCGAAFGGV